METGKHILHFQKTITKWDEAVPLGNGRLGALIWGEPDALRFSLDRADIWDLTPYPGIFEKDFTYRHLVKLAQEGKEEELREKFDYIYNEPTPSKLPAGKLILKLPAKGNVESDLNYKDASAEIKTGKICLESFIHAQKKLGMIRLNVPLEQFSYEVESPACIRKLLYPEPERTEFENGCRVIQTISDSFAYGVFVAVKQEEGNTLLAFGVASSNDGKNWKEEMWDLLLQSLEDGYEKLYEEHTAWWSAFWKESSLSIPDKFMEQQWYLTNYLLASCSRKGGYPMQLQGLWTADDGELPPWKGDYHHDLNTQLSYLSYLKANHLEEGECFLDFLWEMVEKGEQFSKSFYETEGMCLPSVMGLDGTPLGGWVMYCYSPTNQIWLCQFFERHYRYTGDRVFLKEKAYPYMKKTAMCILGLLEEKDGRYYLPVSSSPEIHNGTLEAFLTPNSNYDLALLRYLFMQLADLAKDLKNHEEMKWLEVLRKLPELAVNGEGVMMLSPDEELAESHRHFSHLMAIHPLRLIDYHTGEGRRVVDANVHRLEELGSGFWVGYSFALMAEMYAIQRNGNGAAYQLRIFWDSFCSQNGFHLNGDYKNHGVSQFHYRPFTLEGNMCAADALQEMLMQSEKEVIELFPAIPDEWLEKTVSFRHFRAEGGILVSAVLEKGQVTELKLEKGRNQKAKVRITPSLHKIARENGWDVEDDCYVI